MNVLPCQHLGQIRVAIETYTGKHVVAIEKIFIDVDLYDDLRDYDSTPYSVEHGDQTYLGEIFVVYQSEHDYSRVWLYRAGVQGLPQSWSRDTVFKEGGVISAAAKDAILFNHWNQEMGALRHFVVVALT